MLFAASLYACAGPPRVPVADPLAEQAAQRAAEEEAERRAIEEDRRLRAAE
jgi:hypothetical protein